MATEERSSPAADRDASVSGIPDLAPATRRSSVSPWQRFRRHKLAMIGFAILAFFTATAVLAPLITQHEPNKINLKLLKRPPCWSTALGVGSGIIKAECTSGHLFGTDRTGRDVFSRLLYAGRVSLTVGVAAAGISAAIGTVLGLISGFFGHWTDNALQRFTELVMTFPTLFAVIILVGIVGPSIWNIIFVLGGLGWTGTVRVVRGQVLSIREMDYVLGARALGASNKRLMFRHILPGVMPYVAVGATLTVAGAILTEASLSFLGFGVRAPTATWGSMMNQAQRLFILRDMPWLWLPPGAAISLTVIAVNFMGDGLRDALDPRTRID
jgi:peptide/nickel transport system permease protein